MCLKKKKVELTYNELIPSYNGSHIELRLLFQNLIFNGIKYRKRHLETKIHIDFKIVDEKLILSFTDNGIGIRDENKEKIFNIFTRLHNYDEIKGRGIGLAHCKKIVELYFGNIYVKSEFNKGSTFFIELPY